MHYTIDSWQQLAHVVNCRREGYASETVYLTRDNEPVAWATIKQDYGSYLRATGSGDPVGDAMPIVAYGVLWEGEVVCSRSGETIRGVYE